MGSVMNLLKLRRNIISSEPHLVTVETGNTEDSDVIASFKTNTTLPLKSIVTNFEPKQDLNGYSSPFPEGGGSNILEVSAEKHFTSNASTYDNWTESDNVLTITGNCQGGYLVSCEPDTTYTYSFKYDTQYTTRFHARVWEGTEDPIISISTSMMTINTTLYNEPNAVFTFTTKSDTVCLVVGFYVHDVESPITVTEMQLEKGFTATKYNAYGSSNICPIEGLTELQIHNYPYLVQWNQWLQPISEENWNPYNANNISVAYSDGIATSEWLVDSTGGYLASIRNKVQVPNPEGHIWYVSYMVRHHAQGIKHFGVEFAGGRQIRAIVTAEPDVWYQVSTVGSWYRNTNAFVYISNISDSEGEIGLIVESKSPIYIDLTRMYGAGNEPTKEEFEAQCALNGIDLTTYNPYDEGSVIPWRTSADEDRVYQVPLTLPNLITPEPKSITSYNVDFTVNEDGTVDYEGTPTSYAGVVVGFYYPKGGETITATICGDNANICFNAIQIFYDSKWNNPYPALEGKKTFTLDLSEFTDASIVRIVLKRMSNDVYMKGRCWVRVVEGTVDTGDEVFGGYVDLENNEFVKTWECVGLDSLKWSIFTANTDTYTDATSVFTNSSCINDISTAAKKDGSGIQWFVSGLKHPSISGANRTQMSARLKENNTFSIAQSGGSGMFTIRADDYDNVNEFQRFLQGKKVTYPKEVPVHFPLSPTVIRTLKGMNNIYTNANGKSIIKYWTH